MPRGSRQSRGRKSGQGGQGQSRKPSPPSVEKFLRGVDFPAQKQQLIEQARKNEAPQDVLSFLEQLEEKEYSSPVEVTQQMKKAA